MLNRRCPAPIIAPEPYHTIDAADVKVGGGHAIRSHQSDSLGPLPCLSRGLLRSGAIHLRGVIGACQLDSHHPSHRIYRENEEAKNHWRSRWREAGRQQAPLDTPTPCG